MLEYDQKKHHKIQEPVEFLQWKEKLTMQPDKSNIGRYINQLEEDQISIFDHLAYNELKRYGYLVWNCDQRLYKVLRYTCQEL